MKVDADYVCKALPLKMWSILLHRMNTVPLPHLKLLSKHPAVTGMRKNINFMINYMQVFCHMADAHCRIKILTQQ